MRTLFSLLAVCLCFSSLQAATYYVRTDGNNSNAGTSNTSGGAWLTIQKAANTAVAGDTVTVANGTYAENVNTFASGSSGSPITFNAASTSAIFYSLNVTHAYNVWNGFTINGNAGSANSVVYLNSGSAHDTISNCIIGSTTANQFQVNMDQSGVSYFLLTHCTILNNANCGVKLWGTNHVVSYNHFGPSDGAGDAINVFASNLLISHNDFVNWGNPFGLGPHTDLIQSFTLDNTMSASYVTVDSNYAIGGVECQIGNIADNMGNGAVSHWLWTNNVFSGIDYAMGVSAPYSEYYNNTFYRCGNNTAMVLSFLKFNYQSPFTTAGVNTAADTITPTPPIEFTTGDRIMFFDNPPSGLTTGQFGSYYARITSGVTFSVYDTSAHAIAGGATGLIDLTTTGNNSPGMGVSVWVSSGRAEGVGHDCIVKNNIFSECGSAPSSATSGWYDLSTAPPNFTADYNLVVGTGAGTTKSGFVSGGREAHGINGSDPLFVNPASNWNIHSGSPAINAGLTIGLFSVDFLGTSRPQSTAWDIGAYEFISGGGDTTAPTPDPATIASTSHTSSSVGVTATTATDETSLGSSPYRFSKDNGSTWTSYQSSASYTFNGLTASTAYPVKVQYQDAAGNSTNASLATTVTTDAGSVDTTAPTPSPSTIASTSHTSSSVSVTATTATDAGSPPVQYRFSKDGGATWSAWQSSSSFTFPSLTSGTTYSLVTQARDSASSPNSTVQSSATSVTTDSTVPSDRRNNPAARPLTVGF